MKHSAALKKKNIFKIHFFLTLLSQFFYMLYTAPTPIISTYDPYEGAPRSAGLAKAD